jgi:hypothetical protein
MEGIIIDKIKETDKYIQYKIMSEKTEYILNIFKQDYQELLPPQTKIEFEKGNPYNKFIKIVSQPTEFKEGIEELYDNNKKYDYGMAVNQVGLWLSNSQKDIILIDEKIVKEQIKKWYKIINETRKEI